MKSLIDQASLGWINKKKHSRSPHERSKNRSDRSPPTLLHDNVINEYPGNNAIACIFSFPGPRKDKKNPGSFGRLKDLVVFNYCQGGALCDHVTPSPANNIIVLWSNNKPQLSHQNMLQVDRILI